MNKQRHTNIFVINATVVNMLIMYMVVSLIANIITKANATQRKDFPATKEKQNKSKGQLYA